MVSMVLCSLLYPSAMTLTVVECLSSAVFSWCTLLSMAVMLASVDAFLSSWLSRRVVIVKRRFCRVAMLDSDFDSLSRSVLADACELVRELDGVLLVSCGVGHVRGISGPIHGEVPWWTLLPRGCLATNALLFISIMFWKPW